MEGDCREGIFFFFGAADYEKERELPEEQGEKARELFKIWLGKEAERRLR